MSGGTAPAKPPAGPQWEAARMPNGDVYLRRVGGGAARLVTAAEAIVMASFPAHALLTDTPVIRGSVSPSAAIP